MKRVLSVSLGPVRDDFTVEAQLLGQQVQLSRVGTDGDWQRALELVRRSDGQVAAIGVAGIRLYRRRGAGRRPSRDHRAAAIREAVKVSRLADGQRVRSMMARRAVAALEAHLNKSGASLEKKQAFLPLAGHADAVVEHLAAFGCRVTAGDLYPALGVAIPVRGAAVGWLGGAASWALAALRRLRRQGADRRDAEAPFPPRWQEVLDAAEVVAASSPDELAAANVSAAGKIVVLEAATRRSLEELRRQGARLVVSAGPELGGHCLEPNAVEALLLALSEKPEAEIEVADLEAAAARIPLRPAVYGPWQAR